MARSPIPPEVLRVIAAMEATAAFGAWHRARAEGLAVPPEVTAALGDVLAAADLPLDPADAGGPPALGMVRALFQQGWELLSDPERPPGWQPTDPRLLQAQGRASASIPPLLDGAADGEPELAAALRRPGARFLDVGTGVGWLAIAAARVWPEASVVGIDIWEPSLALAAQNVAEAGLGERVAIRRADVTTFADGVPFDVVWLPGPFLPRGVLDAAVGAARRILRPGGWVVLGCYAGQYDPLTEALAALRTVRSGGVPLDEAQAAALLSAAGFVGPRELPLSTLAPMRFYVGRSP